MALYACLDCHRWPTLPRGDTREAVRISAHLRYTKLNILADALLRTGVIVLYSHVAPAASRSWKELWAPGATRSAFETLTTARVDSQVYRLHPHTQLKYNVQLLVLRTPQHRVMT